MDNLLSIPVCSDMCVAAPGPVKTPAFPGVHSVSSGLAFKGISNKLKKSLWFSSGWNLALTGYFWLFSPSLRTETGPVQYSLAQQIQSLSKF